MQKFAGIAPVTEPSGNKCWVHWRWACPKFLRQTFVEWVAQTTPHSYWAKAFHAKQRARGARHQAALRALAFKWIRILHRCWIDRVPYNEARYLNMDGPGSGLERSGARRWVGPASAGESACVAESLFRGRTGSVTEACAARLGLGWPQAAKSGC